MSINPTNNCAAANLAVQMSTGHLLCADEEPGCGTKVPGFHPPLPHASALDQGGLNALPSPPSHVLTSRRAPPVRERLGSRASVAPPDPRRGADEAPEHAREMTLFREAGLERDLDDRGVRVEEELLRT